MSVVTLPGTNIKIKDNLRNSSMGAIISTTEDNVSLRKLRELYYNPAITDDIKMLIGTTSNSRKVRKLIVQANSVAAGSGTVAITHPSTGPLMYSALGSPITSIDVSGSSLITKGYLVAIMYGAYSFTTLQASATYPNEFEGWFDGDGTTLLQTGSTIYLFSSTFTTLTDNTIIAKFTL